MPRIARFHQLGGPEVLKIEEIPSKEPGKGEARLRVQAIGLNRAESMFMHGAYLEPPRLPAGLGYEAAGVINAVGPELDPAWLNKNVSVIPSFSLNEYGMAGEEVLVPVHALAEYPAHLTPAEAASIWMQYMTAYGALIEFGQLKKGEFVLITAASSSAGLAGIATAKAEQAVAIATTRKSDKRNDLLTLGADHVIVTEEEDLVSRVQEITGGKGARIIFDPVAGPQLEQLARAAAAGATIFEYGNLSQAPATFPALTAVEKGLNIRGYWLLEIVTNPERFARGKQYVHDRVKKGLFRPKVAKTFPFEEIVKAYQYLESNAQIGKVVVTVP